MGLTSHRNLQLLLFGFILLIYLLTVLGNTLIITLVQFDLNLNTPMYYFISHLAGLDISYVTSTMPLMLSQLLAGDGTISFTNCVIQMYLSSSLGTVEIFLLVVMAYDQFLAISHPLVYPVMMSKLYQLHFASACWVAGPLICAICIVSTALQNYCGPNQIIHFICEMLVVLKLACGDTRIAEAICFFLGAFFFWVPLATVLTTYGFMLRIVLQMKSSIGRCKAFSTCGSHFLVLFLFYGPLFCMYLLPNTDSDSDRGKQMAVFYIVITPLLNSIIYTLRNKDIHKAVAKIL